MTIALKGWGTATTGFSTTLTPTAPSFAIGDCLLYLTAEFAGSDAIPTTPSGWTVLPSTTSAHGVVWGLISLTGAESMPSVSWGAQTAMAAVGVYSGVDAAMTQAFASPTPRITTSTQNIAGPAVVRTPTDDNSLMIFFGTRNKLVASNGTVYSAPTNFTMRNQGSLGGTNLSWGLCDWIQTTATAWTSGATMSGSIADGTAQHLESFLFGLLSSTPVLAPPTSGGIFVCP